MHPWARGIYAFWAEPPHPGGEAPSNVDLVMSVCLCIHPGCSRRPFSPASAAPLMPWLLVGWLVGTTRNHSNCPPPAPNRSNRPPLPLTAPTATPLPLTAPTAPLVLPMQPSDTVEFGRCPSPEPYRVKLQHNSLRHHIAGLHGQGFSQVGCHPDRLDTQLPRTAPNHP